MAAAAGVTGRVNQGDIMGKFDAVDATLRDWAGTHALAWLTEYQDDEVRTLFLGPSEAKNRVQVWVDPPVDRGVNVQIYQHRLHGQSRSERIACSLADLQFALDRALLTARSWIDT